MIRDMELIRAIMLSVEKGDLYGMRLVHNALKNSSALLVNVIHDELVIECDDHEAQDIGAKVTTAMTDAATEYITEVPVLAEPTIATSWIKN